MPHDPKSLQAIVRSAAPPDTAVTFRSMFGGIVAYADGRPFASLADVGLGLKLAGADHAQMLALPGAAPLRYAPDLPASKSYVLVPEPMLADREDLRLWITRSVAALQAARPKRAKAPPP